MVLSRGEDDGFTSKFSHDLYNLFSWFVIVSVVFIIGFCMRFYRNMSTCLCTFQCFFSIVLVSCHFLKLMDSLRHKKIYSYETGCVFRQCSLSDNPHISLRTPTFNLAFLSATNRVTVTSIYSLLTLHRGYYRATPIGVYTTNTTILVVYIVKVMCS